MTCLRCEGFLVRECLLNPQEGSLSGFHAVTVCVNCGAIHDDVIRTNQRMPPSLKRVRSPIAGRSIASPPERTPWRARNIKMS